jgi:thioester reductase-like protein
MSTLSCQKVDLVFHAAVKANHIETYKKSKTTNDIRSVNVIGTMNILEFATTSRTKRVAFTSSFSAATELDKDGFLSEDLPSESNNAENIGEGYAFTKFVGEKLLSQAIKRGIPCQIFRLATLSGNSKTGHFTLDSNFIELFPNSFATASLPLCAWRMALIAC